MSKGTAVIRLRGVRHNNLKNFDLDLPLKKLIVVTGLSGSGKSSLAFDTLYAEGQRRYIETFSPYARQFFDRMDKPQVDKIEGIPPAIAIEQRNAVRTTRSTVGTMTEIADYMKVLWPHMAQLHCRQCGQPVRKDSPRQIWDTLTNELVAPRSNGVEVLITFNLPLAEKLSLKESLALISRQGYQRLLLPDRAYPHKTTDPLVLREAHASDSAKLRGESGAEGRVVRVEDTEAALSGIALTELTVVQDRIRLSPGNRARFCEACEQAYHFGKGKLTIHPLTAPDPLAAGSATIRHFSNRLHCAACDIEYRDPTPALFSFNHPVGACPACRGFGRIISIDYTLAIPDRSLTLAGGAVKPWQTSTGLDCQRDLSRMCKALRIPMNVPFRELSPEHQRWVIDGDPEYGTDEEHEWPRAWYGVKGYFRWLETKAYKMHVRVLLSRYRAYQKCPACDGQRFQPDALLYRMRSAERGVRNGTGGVNGGRANLAADQSAAGSASSFTLADFYALSVHDALRVVTQIGKGRRNAASDPVAVALTEVQSRLRYLDDVGLGYLTLDRPTRTLSGGETERVNLTTCLGTRLVNTLFVLDEPSVGLHPRDTDRLVQIVQKLRDAGNTVVVVEHEPSVMRAADQIVDLGPGHGESGGQVVFQGSFRDILKHRVSLTGAYLSGRKRIEVPHRREVIEFTPKLELSGATLHNLKNLTVRIPLGRLVCITGVSGSGKSTLVRDVLFPLLNDRVKGVDGDRGQEQEQEQEKEQEKGEGGRAPDSAAVRGCEAIERVVMVDQSAIGRTPRSNPAVYIGAFDDIRELFATSPTAQQRGLAASAFSFNSIQGQCERCRGAGFEKIEMQFLSDVFVRCPDCGGRRYRAHILEVRIARPSSPTAVPAAHRPTAEWSIADMLDATVDEAIEFLGAFPESRPAGRAMESLRLLQEVGLGYLRLGQPINTLSGGESQRLKLVSHLAEAAQATRRKETGRSGDAPPDPSDLHSRVRSTLFLFDEPTTGLHFDDIRVLLGAFQRLAGMGHSIIVIEHNLEVIKCADWVIDLGPEAGDGGGELVIAGTPEQVAACEQSHTGRALRSVLDTPLR